MMHLLTPHLQLANVHEINGEMLRSLGVEGLLVDLDCTLKDYYETEIPDSMVAWVESIKRVDVAVCMLTNGTAARVEPLAARLGILCVPWATKPLTRGVRAALQKIGLDRTRVALVGDQIFADVLAGRLAGVFTILVKPTTTREPWITRIKRPLERFVLRRIARDNPAK